MPALRPRLEESQLRSDKLTVHRLSRRLPAALGHHRDMVDAMGVELRLNCQVTCALVPEGDAVIDSCGDGERARHPGRVV